MNFPDKFIHLDFIDDYIVLAKHWLNSCGDVLDLCEMLAVDAKKKP